MRKFFALALAVAMVLSLASVAFAVDLGFPETAESDIVLSKFYKYDGDDDSINDTQAQYGKSYYAMIFEGKWTINDYDDDEVADNAADTKTITYAPITDYKQVEKMKIKTDYEMGEDLVESVSIVKKLFGTDAGVITPAWETIIAAKPSIDQDNDHAISVGEYEDTTHGYGSGTAASSGYTFPVKKYVSAANVADSLGKIDKEYVAGGATWAVSDEDYPAEVAADKYYYFVEIKTKAQRVTGDADVIGTFEFSRKKKDVGKPTQVNEIDDIELDFDLNLFYEKNYNTPASMYLVDGSQDVELKWDKLYVLKFECDDEATFTFGQDDLNEGEFNVDVSGQGKMVIDFDTKANEAIVAANPGVKMFFVNFNGAKFNRTGEFEYEMEDMVCAYEVVDDQLVEIKGLEISGDTATFNTRALGNYVFADAEIVSPVAAVEAPAVEAPAVTNPSTGAAA